MSCRKKKTKRTYPINPNSWFLRRKMLNTPLPKLLKMYRERSTPIDTDFREVASSHTDFTEEA